MTDPTAQDTVLLPVDPADVEQAASFGPMFTDPEASPHDPPEEPPGPVADLDERATADFTGLLYLGYLEDECTVVGHRFLLRTPSQDERLEMGMLHRPYLNSVATEPAWRSITVAAFLRRIDSANAPEPLTAAANQVRDRFEWLQKSVHSSVVIEKLFDRCLELAARERDVVDFLDGQGEA